MVVILSSYVAIGLGVVLLAAGYYTRRKRQSYSQYLLASGGLLVTLGVLGLLWFMAAFS